MGPDQFVSRYGSGGSHIKLEPISISIAKFSAKPTQRTIGIGESDSALECVAYCQQSVCVGQIGGTQA